jgi:hypothetical protein
MNMREVLQLNPEIDSRYRHVRMYILEEDAQRLDAKVAALQAQQQAEREQYLKDRRAYFDSSAWAANCEDGKRTAADIAALTSIQVEQHSLLHKFFMDWRKDIAGKRGDQRRQRPVTYLLGDVVSALLHNASK